MRTTAEHLAKFNKSVSILVKAYLNGTLAHRECAACAVGNLIAGTIGASIIKDDDNYLGIPFYNWIRNGQQITIAWDEVFCTSNGVQKFEPQHYIGQIKRQIDITGYTVDELARIEFAFETCEVPGDCDIDFDIENSEWMFNGLMAVVDVLASIHGVDLETTEAARKMFVKV